jgi:hypothetical protein
VPKVVFATPTLDRPYEAYLASLEACLPAVEAAGFEHSSVFEIGCAYISAARARMLGKALKADADIIVFLDHDVSWTPEDMVKLLTTEGDVVAGTYRFKTDAEVKYMGCVFTGPGDKPLVREDGCILADRVPAGFLKVTRKAVERFAEAYPHLVLHKETPPSVDIFNHGAHEGLWWGEDYTFSRRWRECGGEVWLIPDLNIGHHTKTGSFPGNFHEYMLRQPGGSKWSAECPTG